MSDSPTTVPEVDTPGEIEITPEMIEAGAECLRAYYEEIGHGRSIFLVKRILRAALLNRSPASHTPWKIMKF